MDLVFWIATILLPGKILWELGLRATLWPNGPGIAYLIALGLYVGGAYWLWRLDRGIAP